MVSLGRLMALSGLLGALACTIGSPTHSVYNEAPKRADGGAKSTSSSGNAADDGASSSSGAPKDPGSPDADCCKKGDGTGKGQCVDDTQIPEEQRDDAEQLECGDAKKCVPIALATDHPIPCEIALMDGVCMDKCFSTYLAYTAGLLESDDCDPEDACIPCKFLPDVTPGCTP